MKKLRNTFAAVVIAVCAVLAVPATANAAMIPPQTVHNGTVYNCSGPYWVYNGWHYYCYIDYNWWAEVFEGKHDMWMYLKPWYTA